MTGNLTSNTPAAIRAQVYSNILMQSINEGFLPDGLFRDVSDFGDGNTLFIPTMGDVTIYDIEEDKDLPISPVDTGQITLTINEFKGTGWSSSDKLKQDAYMWQAMESQIPAKALEALKTEYETNMLAALNAMQTAGADNSFNGFAHRLAASGTSGVISVADFAKQKLAFDKAHMPSGGRIAIVDATTEYTLNNIANLVNVSNNPMFEGVVTEGFARDRKFLYNIFGWDVWVSDRLPRIESETIGGTTVTNGVANIFMCVADDMVKPLMGAWRQQPEIEGVRRAEKKRDEFYLSARYGFGGQRSESLGVVVSTLDVL